MTQSETNPRHREEEAQPIDRRTFIRKNTNKVHQPAGGYDCKDKEAHHNLDQTQK